MSFRGAPLLPWSSRSCGGSGGMTASRRLFLPSRSSPPAFLYSFSFVPSSSSLSPTYSSPYSSPSSSFSSASHFCAAYDSARRSCSCVTFPDAPWICCTPSRASSPAYCCCRCCCSARGQSVRWRSSGSNSRSCGSRNSSNNNSDYNCNNTRRCWSTRRKSVSDGGRGSGGGLAFSATDRESEGHSRVSSLLLLRRRSHACPSLQKQKAVTSADITCATSLFRDSAAAASAFFLLPRRGTALAFASAAELRRPAGVATAHRSKRRRSCQREQSNAQAARAAAATADVGAAPAGSAAEEGKAAATAGEAGAAGEVGLPEGGAATAAAAQVVFAAVERAAARPARAAAVEAAAAATEREKKKERSQRWKTGPVKRETSAKIFTVREGADNGVCGRVVDSEREETRREGETTERKEKRPTENQPALGLRRQQTARTAVCWTPRAAAAAAATAPLLPAQGVSAASASSSFSSSPPRSLKAANSRPLVAYFHKVSSPLQAIGQVIAAPVAAGCAAAAAPAARRAPPLCGAVPLFDGPAAASAAPAAAVAVPLPVASAPQDVAAAHVVGPPTRKAVPASFSASWLAVAADGRVSPAVDAPASRAARGFDCLRRYPAAAAASPFRAGDDLTAEGAFVFLSAVEGYRRELLSSFCSFSSPSSSHPPVRRAAAAALPSSAAVAAAPRREGVAAAAQFAVAASTSLRTTNAAAGAATPAAAATTIVATAAAAIATATPAIVAAAAGPPHVAAAASAPVTAGLCNPAAAAPLAAPARRASFYAAAFSAALCGKIPATSPATVLPAAVGAAVFSSFPCSSCPSPFPSAVLTHPSGSAVAAPPAACASLSTNTSSISPAAAAFCLPAFPSSPAPAAVAAGRGSIAGASSRPFTSAKGPSCSPSSCSLPSSFCTFFAASCSSAFSAFRPFPSAMPRYSLCAHGAAGPFLRRGSPLRRSSCGGSSPALFSSPSSCDSPRPPPYLSSTFPSCRTLFSTSFLSRFPPRFPSFFLSCASVSSASSASISSPSSDRAPGSPLRAPPATDSRGSELGSLSPLRAEELQVQPKLLSLLSATPDPARLGFGQFYTDHMIEVDWDDVYGWYSPVLRPLAPVSVHPGVSALHYAISAFEGLKAFRAADDRLLLFRPHDHARRLVSSCTRVTLPSFSADALVKLCKQLVRIDSRFVFPAKGLSLYLRPIVFSTYPTLGVHPPRMAKMLIIACPTSGYFSNAGEGTHLYVEQEYRRSWPGSAGSHKVAANYAPSILPCKVRMQQGFQQLLWTAPAAVPPPPLPSPRAAPPSLQGEETAAAAAAVERGAAKQATQKSEGSELAEERAATTGAGGGARSTTAAAGNGRAAGEGQLLAARSEADARTEAAGEATQREGGRPEEVGDNRRRTAECPGARRSRKEKETAGGTAAAVASRAARAAAVQKEEEAARAGEREGKRGGELLATAGEENDLLWCEGGAMSIFILWKNEKGEEELATPALERDLILPGIMRDTVLHIARGYPNITVTERRILMRRDFLPAYEEGRVREIFCTGTGAVVIPVAVLHFEGRNFNCMPADKSASLARRLLHDVYKIQYGEVPHHFVEEC